MDKAELNAIRLSVWGQAGMLPVWCLFHVVRALGQSLRELVPMQPKLREEMYDALDRIIHAKARPCHRPRARVGQSQKAPWTCALASRARRR